jgi:putative inorganic carbon (hco3(-)) transporter
MIADKLSPSATSGQSAARWIDWLSVVFATLAIILGIAIAVSVGEFGTLALLAIPLMLIFVAALGQPQLGLVAFIIITFTQLSNVGIKYYGFPSLAQPLAGLLFMLILLRISLYGERPLGWVRAGPVLLIYAIVWFASLLHAGDFQAASTTFIGFVKDALGAVIVIFFIQKPSSLKGAVWALVLAGLFMGMISVFQTLTGTFGNNYFGFGGWQAQVSGDASGHRLTGPYDNPNAFAQVLVVIIPLALDRLWSERNIILRLLAGFATLLGVITIVFTYSRGGFLAMLFALGIYVVLRRPNFFPLILTAALAIGLIQFLPDTYSSRILTLFQLAPSQNTLVTDTSFLGRTSENIAAWRMFLDHPVLGVGLGNYSVNYQDYSRSIGLDTRRTPRTPASLYMELLSEQGVVGTAIFAFLLILIFRELRSARRNFRSSGLHDEAYMVTAIFAGFAGYMFSAIFKNSAYSNAFWVIVGIALAAGQVAYISRQAHFEKSIKHPGTGE